MRRNRIWYGAALAAALLIYIVANSRETLAFLLSMIVIPLVMVGIQVGAMKGFEAQYELKRSCRVRQKIPLQIQVRKNNRLPLGMTVLEFDYENVMYGEKHVESVLLQPAEKKEMIYRHMIKMEDCGNVKITLKQVKCYDKLGLFCWNRWQEVRLDTMVYPAQIRINTQLSGRFQTTVSGELYDQTRKGSDVSEVFGLRGYVEGDPLGSIHWKLSSKVDELVVREFGYPSNYNVLILYDMMKECDGNRVANQRNNAVLALTSALSYSLLEQNLEHNVGRVFAGQYQELPVYSVGTHEQMVLNLLCRAISGKERRGESLYHLLHSELRSHYTKIIYITPEYEEEMARQLSRELNLTIIQAIQGSGKVWADSAGYAVIPVDADHYREKIHNIII